MNELIAQSVEFMKAHLHSSKATVDEVDYRIGHSLRVANIGRRIAEAEGGNIDIVTVAGILHDVGKFDTNDNMEHGRVSEMVARSFLSVRDIEYGDLEHICHCIGAHVDGRSSGYHLSTLEEKIVRDADTIDRFGAHKTKLRFYWEIDHKNISFQEAAETTKNTLTMLEECALDCRLETKEGKRRFKRTIGKQIEFYQSIVDELSYSFDIV